MKNLNLAEYFFESMKALFFVFIIILCFSCAKEPMDIPDNGNVKISIDYAFVSSGNITAKSESSYLDFYTKYITNKVLMPKTYSITFEGLYHNVVGNFKGKWSDKRLVFLPPDRYAISGISWPTKYPVSGDTCYLKFHDTINITQTTTNITLKAYYDCSLILLDTADVRSTKFVINEMKWNYSTSFADAVKSTMMKTDYFYHTFYNFGAIENCVPKNNISLCIYSKQMEQAPYPAAPGTLQSKTAEIILWLYPWVAGKYYYYSNSSNGYTLLPMTN